MKEETPALIQPPPADPVSSGVSAPDPQPGPDPVRAPEPAPALKPASLAVDEQKKGGAGWAGVIAVLCLIAVAFIGWQVFELRKGVGDVRQETAQRLSGGESAVAETRALSRQQQEAISALQGKLGALESQVAAFEGQAVALESLYQEFSRTREDRVSAEVEQAISVAAQQLQLAGNIEAALVALQGAEARLAAQDRGQLQPLRRALTRDIEHLKGLPQVDVQGIARRLETLLEQSDALPLAFVGELAENAPGSRAEQVETSGEPSPLNFITDLARDVWREVKSLVRIERLDQAELPVLLAPAQSTFLRENLKIRLLTARLALLARDGRTYAADLAQSRTWVERFFDLRDARVQDVLAELESLQAMPIKIEQAGPTESFAALRLLQARASSGGASNGAAVPQPANGQR